MEKVGETKKRNDTDRLESVRKRKRTKGNDAIEFFKEKFEHERKLKEKELSLQQQQNKMSINMLQNTLLQQQQRRIYGNVRKLCTQVGLLKAAVNPRNTES